jgi:hypothetical protein
MACEYRRNEERLHKLQKQPAEILRGPLAASLRQPTRWKHTVPENFHEIFSGRIHEVVAENRRSPLDMVRARVPMTMVYYGKDDKFISWKSEPPKKITVGSILKRFTDWTGEKRHYTQRQKGGRLVSTTF